MLNSPEQTHEGIWIPWWLGVFRRRPRFSTPKFLIIGQHHPQNLRMSNYDAGCSILSFFFLQSLYCKVTPQVLQTLFWQQSKWVWIKTWYIKCNVTWGTRCLTRFVAPIPEAIFLVSLSLWQLQFVVNCHTKWFWSCNLFHPSTIHCDWWGSSKDIYPLARSYQHKFGFRHI